MYILLDGVNPAALIGLFGLYIVLPVLALIFLIYLFVRYRKKKAAAEKKQDN
jgi:uncharacterized membrane protein